MGSKDKFWCRISEEQESLWLFKYPQPGTGQHWAEKIAAEAADVLQIPHAKVELALFQGTHGSVTESFVRGGRVLHHGNQILERVVRGYDPEKRFHQTKHTLENILRAMDKTFASPKARQLAKQCMAEYLILDALIGNTDRHHENWGILRRRAGSNWRGFVAPTFDHASALGRELLDARRNKFLKENRVGNYAEKGRGAIYWSAGEERAPSPLELMRRAALHYPDVFSPALACLQKLDDGLLQALVHRVPEDWMTRTARMFAIALMRYNLKTLRELPYE